MKHNHVLQRSLLTALVCLSLSSFAFAAPAAEDTKASDPAFQVPTMSNPIPDAEIKDMEIVEDTQGRWLVSDKALEQFGIKAANKEKGTYYFRLPAAQNGSSRWQNETVELALPGRAVKGGRTINIKNVRRPLGISYILGNGTTEKNELLPPSQPINTAPVLKEVSPAPQLPAQTGKMGTVLFWDPLMDEGQSLPKLSTRQPVMSPCAFRLTEKGLEVRNPDLDMLNDSYKENGYAMWPLVDNDFNPKLTHQILANSRLQDTLVRQLIGYALLYDFKGYNLDFENVNYSDKEALTAFVKKISDGAHAYGLQLSMDVTPPSDSPNWSQVYDRAALSPYLDQLMVMAYDEYGRTSPVAGPVASYPWVEKAVQNTLASVPASKVILGMPLYMRLWYESADGKELPKDLSRWPAVTGTPPKGETYQENHQEMAAEASGPMLVQVETAQQEAARRAKEGIIIPIDFNGDTYKRQTSVRLAKAPVKRMMPAHKTSAAGSKRSSGSRHKLFVRTLTMADSEAILKKYKDFVLWDKDLQLYHMELPLATGTVKIWFEDERSLKAKAALIPAYHLGGAAFWRKGFEPAHFWQSFAKHELT